MDLGEVLRDERSIEGKHFADCLPAVEETGCNIEEGSQTDESIVCLYLLGSGMSSIVAYFLYRAHVLFKLPVFVDESIYLWAFEHIVQGFVWGEGNVRHCQMVFYEPFQSLACIGGTLFWECLLKDFCLIAVCVELVEGRNHLCQLFDKVKILHCRFYFNCYCYIFYGQKLSNTGQYTKLLPLQGALLIAMIPRALPWARRGCPFRAQGDDGTLHGVVPIRHGSRFAPYVMVHVLPHTP